MVFLTTFQQLGEVTKSMWPFSEKKTIACISQKLPREELIRRSRILIVDDEAPELLSDLQKAHFAVDHVPDINGSNLDLIDKKLYDLILLDFGGVGSHFGQDEGLSLLRHIKRVNPATVVLSYTSKSLKPLHADFYRLTDGVLSKDAGIADSTEKIEEALRKAHNIVNVWNGLLSVCDIKPGSDEDKTMQDLLVRGLNKKPMMDKLKQSVFATLTSEGARQAGLILLEKAIELGVKSYVVS